MNKSWATRNDSTHVSEILAPDNYTLEFDSPVPPTQQRVTVYSCKPNRKKTVEAHCKSCYCTEGISEELPKLKLKNQTWLMRGKKCEVGQTNKFNHRKWKWKANKSKKYCCKLLYNEDEQLANRHSEDLLDTIHHKVNYTPNSLFLRRLQEESHKNCSVDCIGGIDHHGASDPYFTEQREEYERLKPLYELDYFVTERNKKKEEQISDERKAGENTEDTNNEITEERVLQKPAEESAKHCQCCKCKSAYPFLDSVSSQSLDKVNKFREDNYFETHSATDLINISNAENVERIAASNANGRHVCVHKFVVTKNLRTDPLNADTFGISRCAICNKPMQPPNSSEKPPDSRISKTNNNVSNNGKPKNKITITAVKGGVMEPSKSGGFKHDLQMKKAIVNIGSGNERVELEVPQDMLKDKRYWSDDNGFDGDKRKQWNCKPNPASTFALRFQKGVI